MHTPGLHTPVGGPPGANMGHKYPSMTSVHTMLSQGYLPPGHGFVPKPIKPDKPYGPTFVSVMNRTWRGPGRKYLNYALASFCVAILFLLASGLYIGHRNVSRMIVLRTEVFGAIFTIIFILMVGLTIHLIYKARQESNKWRRYVRFRPDGLYHVVPYNAAYDPEDETELETGTYGRKALREIPKKGRRGKKKRQQQKQPMESVSEEYSHPDGGGPGDGVRPAYRPPPGPQFTRPGAAQVGGQPPVYETMPSQRAPYPPHQGQPGREFGMRPQYQPAAQRGFIPMDSHIQPGRYGQMPIQHGGQGESSM